MAFRISTNPIVEIGDRMFGGDFMKKKLKRMTLLKKELALINLTDSIQTDSMKTITLLTTLTALALAAIGTIHALTNNTNQDHE